MAEEVDFNKIPLEERVQHKVWKARVSGYEECVKHFKAIDDENSNEFSKYIGLLKKFVVDSNAVAQEKGLDAVLAFVEYASPTISGRAAADVVAGVVTKCLNARPKTKQKGIDICKMYLEVEKQEAVQEEILKGLDNKQPKIVAGCVTFLRIAISEFGGKIFTLKPVVKVLPKLFDHSDKNVREETKLLAIEIYKWIKDAVKAQLTTIKPVQMKELEEEWGKLDSTPPKPTRLTRSQQEKQAQGQAPQVDEVAGGTGGGIAEEESQVVDVDPYELLDAVDILSKLPKDFYENMAATKWSTRKEALEQLDKLTSNPKIEGGQFGELMAVLKKVITKDNNVIVVALAGKCVAGLAIGLRTKFAPYATSIVSAILEKFKEKKQNVIISLREAIDAVYLTTNIAAIQEDVIASISSKNPSVREETIKFLTRVCCKSKPADLPRQVLKPICASLSKCMDDTSGPVRDAAAEALGTLLKLLGERAMGPFVDQLDKIKMDKVKEFAEKAEITAAPSRAGVSVGGASQPAKKPETKSAPPKSAAPKSTGSTTSNKKPGGGKPKPSSSVTTKSKPSGKKGPGAKKSAKTDGAASFKDDEVMKEPEMTADEVDAKAEELISANIREQLASTNWKERLAGIEALTQFVNDLDPKTMPSQVLIRTMAKKPGWKESNFQVLKNKFSLCAVIATLAASFSKRSAFYAISGLVDKIGDIKLKDQCKETLMVFAENLSLNYVSLKVSGFASEQKNPKVLAESLNWLGDAIKAFGMKIDIKPHVNYIKQSLGHTNPAVRSSAISTLGVIFMFTGPSLRMFFESEKATLLQQIDSEFEKVKDEKPPAPTRGVISKSTGGDQGESTTAADDGEDDAASSVTNLADLIPRTDISAQIKPEIINELSDKKWQIRGEALQKVSGIFNEAKYVTPNIGDLPGALKARLGDSNKNLVITTLNIISTLVKAMGPGSIKHVKTLVPAVIATLGDSKTHVRAAAISCLNSWFEEIGLVPLIESEVISGALATDNPNMRAEMFGWLEEKLPTQKKVPVEVNLIIPILYSCLESRSADVRKKAQGALPAFMNLVGWDTMVKQTSKLKPASKSTVMSILEKNRPQATSKSASNVAVQKATSQTKAPEKPKANERTQEKSSAPKKSDDGSKKSKTAATSAASKTSGAKASSGKASDSEEDGPVLVPNPNGRDGRIKAEKELKVLKWNFTTPLDEHIDQLKEQMNGCVSKAMLENLFSKDFKYHVVALAALTKAITPVSDPPLKAEAMQSADLILKWCTLRFFDTNTTVLIKCLEFLEALFTLLANEQVKLLEFEASSFLPYLIQKVGDPKDAVRKTIRGLLRWIIKVYPASKLFNYIADGLKSKNAKTRTECLGEIAYLISVYGENVCQPSPAKALPAIAAQIADRDNGVRNAALNAIVEVYNLVGETVYKYLGKISEKDQSLLEERIRRAGKTKAAEPVKPTNQPVKKSSDSGAPVEKKSSKPAIPQTKSNSASTAPPVQQYFSLDFDKIEKTSGSSSNEIPSLVANDDVDDLLKEPVPTLPRTTGSTSSISHGRKMFSPSSSSAAVDYCVSQIASNEIKLAITALKELEDHFKIKGPAVWLKHLNQFLIACVLQLRMILSTHLVSDANQEEDIINLYKSIFNNLFTLLLEPMLARAIPKEIVKDVIHVMISTLLDENLIKLYEGPQVIRCVNKLMLNITEKPDRNHVLGSLIKLLQDSVTHYSSTPKFVDLIMKCTWRVTRMLPASIQELNLSQALLDIHLFIDAHPTSTWKNRPDDTPLRTIKTVLHSLIKLKGDQILDHVNLINNPDQSELVQYIRVTLKTNTTKPQMKKQSSIQDEKSSRELTPQSPKSPKPKTHKISQELHDTLGDIFRKIGSKETTKEGLNALYDFQQQHKNVDIDPFLKQTSEFFQKYIARGLKTIEEERKQANSENIELRMTTSTTMGDPSYFRDRLLVLQKKYGDIQTKEPDEPVKEDASDKVSVNIPSSTPSTLATVDDNLILPSIPKTNSEETPSTIDKPTESSTDLTELRKRLERIKKKAI